ncbi:uncharacterized protein LOC142570448 [Dermacentor variabilis]|uniref:uncharacterized protein LOC142570448 n=1 Tax=Dermacentor variabilis TaxID=34621 RepID=UPI003F5C3FB2
MRPLPHDPKPYRAVVVRSTLCACLATQPFSKGALGNAHWIKSHSKKRSALVMNYLYQESEHLEGVLLKRSARLRVHGHHGACAGTLRDRTHVSHGGVFEMGEGVQHKDLSTHYVAGCTARVSAAITECPSSEPTALTVEDVNAALEHLKTVLGDTNHDRPESVE